MPRSDLRLWLLSLLMAVALLLVVRGERRVSYAFWVPLEARLPRGMVTADPLPSELKVSLNGPWARLRSLDAAEMGPVLIDLSRTGPGPISWYVRADSLHLPAGVHVESIHPAQGSVELLHGRP
ncbi:MAG TPA: hypothetical protein VFE30_00340 [Anaeromyxobacteraceae bacterium]|nr:hypothetical protein [Anaeromyxobacteraceae bacterium]